MIKIIFEMLEIAKENNIKSESINIALVKNKIPENFKEVFKITRLKNG